MKYVTITIWKFENEPNAKARIRLEMKKPTKKGGNESNDKNE